MFQRLKQRLKCLNINRSLDHSQKGQSLVEVMVFAPLLIFLLLGVFEVGYALRGYLALVNSNREITRFAVRPGYLDFSSEETINTSYQSVREWIDTSLAGQLPLDFNEADGNADGFADGNARMIISHLVVDTGLPCEDILSNPEDCDCGAFVEAYEDGETYEREFTLDDIFIHPGLTGHEIQKEEFGPAETVTGPKTTRLDYEALAKEMAANNNKFNCEIMKKGGIPSSNNVIFTEMFYDEPQLFGFPLISNPMTDPVPLYSHTSMRLISAARSLGTTQGNLTDGIDTIGPVCFAYPITTKRSIIDAATPGQIIDIFEGNGSSDFGWLAWNPGNDEEEYLEPELQYPQMSMNDYTNPDEHGDHSLNVGDYVASLGGIVTSTDVRDRLVALVGQELIIPVWDDPGGLVTLPNPNFPPPTVEAFHIVKFVRVRINSANDVNITPAPGTIMATYLGPADNCNELPD